MNSLKRIVTLLAYVWLAGLLFVFFLLGYLFYGVLWAVRYVQTGKELQRGLVAVAAAVCIGGAVWYLFFPLPGRHENVTIAVPHGCTVRMIADTLYKHEIIASRSALIAWLRVSGLARKVQAGNCSFSTRGGVFAAAQALLRAAPLDRTVTVPEGLTIEQTAARIAQVLPIDTAEFIRLCYDTLLAKELGLGEVPSLEGYLFPDSYSFRESALPPEIIRRMAARFKEEYPLLDTSSHLTRSEVVTLASIVEKEAMLAEERPRIAGVFYNRLRLGIPLGADPTVRYIFRKWDGPLHVSELNFPSPYNTRRNKGLPPGPICSPGRASLAAAVSPMKTNELYFVAKWDGSGGHEFSITNREHARKKNDIRKNNERRLRQKEASCIK